MKKILTYGLMIFGAIFVLGQLGIDAGQNIFDDIKDRWENQEKEETEARSEAEEQFFQAIQSASSELTVDHSNLNFSEENEQEAKIETFDRDDTKHVLTVPKTWMLTGEEIVINQESENFTITETEDSYIIEPNFTEEKQNLTAKVELLFEGKVISDLNLKASNYYIGETNEAFVELYDFKTESIKNITSTATGTHTNRTSTIELVSGDETMPLEGEILTESLTVEDSHNVEIELILGPEDEYLVGYEFTLVEGENQGEIVFGLNDDYVTVLIEKVL